MIQLLQSQSFRMHEKQQTESEHILTPKGISTYYINQKAFLAPKP